MKLCFTVRDTGIGMTETQAARLFQPFSQASTSTTRKYRDNGLGLSICRRLVEMMSGQIWAESTLGSGSTFTFTAWFDLGPGTGQPDRRQFSPRHSRGLRLLVVDDNPVAREIMQGELLSLRFRVETVSSARAAIEAVRSRRS